MRMLMKYDSLSLRLKRLASAVFSARADLRTSDNLADPALTKRFNTVYSMLPQSRKDALICHYRQKYGCCRATAMEHAIKDRARDNGLRM